MPIAGDTLEAEDKLTGMGWITGPTLEVIQSDLNGLGHWSNSLSRYYKLTSMGWVTGPTLHPGTVS